MKKTKGLVVLVAMILVMSFTLVGCGTNQSSNSTASPSASSQTTGEKKVELIGSTSVTPLAQEIADAYNKDNADVKINIQGVGSAPGIEAATKGTADIGMSSRNLEGDETKAGLKEYQIATDAIAVAVNPSNKVTALTLAQIGQIFTGKVKNWKEVGGDDEPIILISREAGSGTRTAFEELCKLQKDVGNGKKISLVDDAAPIIADGNGAVKSNVAAKKGAIGYLSLGIVDTTVKKVTVDGVEPTTETASSGSYKLSRPFLLLTKGEATGEAKNFIDYILSADGQNLVEKNGYIKVK